MIHPTPALPLVPVSGRVVAAFDPVIIGQGFT